MSNDQQIWSLAQWEHIPPPDKLTNERDHRVSFLAKQKDFDCVLLAQFGMTMKTIAKHTGLTTGQVSYRLKKSNVKIQDFRRGVGPYAQMVFQYLGRRAAQQVTMDFRRKLSE